MKSFGLVVMVGLALGASAVCACANAPSSIAPAFEEKAELTPKFKAGDSFTFKQRIVRSETKIIGGIPKAQDPAPAKEEGKAGGDGKDEPKPDAKKDEAKKDEPKKDDPKAGGQILKQSWSIDQTATYALRVTSVNESGYALELELKGVVASAELPTGKATWSSDTPPDDKDMTNPLIVAYKPIIGAIARISMSLDGNITTVQADPRVNLKSTGTLAPMIQLTCSPDMVKFRWGPILWPRDGKEPVAVGGTWKNVEEVPNPAIGRFVYTTTNTLKSFKDNLAQIDFTGEIGLVPLETMKSSPGTITEQMVKGSATFDTKFGLIKSQTWSEKSHLDVNAMGFPVQFEKQIEVTTTRE